ncbi:MAG: tripartite tricarboxylate transporter TctB family protein [Peptococcaceae bacterium]|nr:tripartite tricarboxylate transporter TctB family protein [Peptococcaceae bacterium]
MTDIGVVVFMYAICGFFYYHMTKLQANSQTYPRFTIVLLFGLTTLYLLQMVMNARKYGITSGVDEVFNGFMVVQFFVCLVLSIIYLVMVKYIGFFVATIVFMIAVLAFLRVPKVHAAIAVVAINLLVYLAFVQFLGVKLPAGLLF